MRRARVASGRSVLTQCPVCRAALDAWTGAHFAEPGERLERPQPAAGDPTVCTTCATLLVFADAAGHLRRPTAAERERFAADEVVQRLRAALIARAASGPKQ